MKAFVIDDDEVVEWIDFFLELNRYAPSVRELSDFLGLGVATTHDRLKQLREKQRVTWNENDPRTLRTLHATDIAWSHQES